MNDPHAPNRRWWNEVTPVHVASRLYDVNGFLAGRESLHAIELAALPDVADKSLLHLQCHFGLDSLSWARRGARVTGVDFSEVALGTARDLAKKLDLEARCRFVCCDVLEADRHVGGPFDVVFTSYGVLAWLSDLRRWAGVVARSLRPGGTFFIAEVHPTSQLFDDDGEGGLTVAYDYFHRAEPLLSPGDGSDYADRSYRPTAETHEWIWSLSDVIGALLEAGLVIEELREHPFTVWRQFACLIETRPREWRFPEGSRALPLLFSIKARKPPAR